MQFFLCMHVQIYLEMWAYGHHFLVESVDNGKHTCDCGVFSSLDQISHASSKDTNLIDR
jgi:hypothetical protein